jgi:NAD(P)H-nitrite reductase large subunit
MRRAPRHRLRPGGAAVRAGQGLRQPPGQLRHRPLHRLGDLDQAQGHRHRPVFGRQLHGRPGTDEIVLNDPAGGVYKKLVVKDDKLVGAVLYGDTADGAWYFQLVKDGQDIHEIRDHLLFGQNHVGDVGHASKAAATMPDERRSLRLQRRLQGRHRQGDQEKGLFTLDDVRKHTKAASSCGSCTGLVEQILASTIGGAYTPAAPRTSRCAAAPTFARRGARDHPRAAPAEHPEVMRFMEWKTPNGCAKCRPALNYYLISTWPGEAKDDPQSRFINERAHANIQKDGTYSVVPRMWGGLTTPAELRAHRRRRREVPGADGQGHRRPAHRPARHQEGRPAQGLGRPRAPPAWSPATPTARASAP